MSIWVGVLVFILLISVGLLLIKVYLLKKSTREISNLFEEKIKSETNTLIQISSRDKDMRRLAASINTQLKIFNQSRQKFEHGDLELKEAITNVSHDLRTPLTAIYGYLRLLQNNECSEVSLGYIKLIENRIKAMKQLTEELFQYTLMISDAEEFAMKTVNLNGVLENCISSYYIALKEKGITPEIKIPDKKIFCRGNEDALIRVFSNIISNAIKYSDGEMKITLLENGKIIFSNRAYGLDEIQVGRLFDRFYTVTSARKSTGLGLAISKELIEKMNGNIFADYKDERLSICISLVVI